MASSIVWPATLQSRRTHILRSDGKNGIPALSPTQISFSRSLSSSLGLKKVITRPIKPRCRTVRSLFTGIVEEVGSVIDIGPASGDSAAGAFRIQIAAETVLSSTRLGDSISVDGTCLTVAEIDLSSCYFAVGCSPETLRRTTLGRLSPGSAVNLERAVMPDTRLGGHFVQGHVDGTGEIVSIYPEGDSLWFKVRAPKEVIKLVVSKGFIAVDGTSLTVVNVYEEESCFDFMLVKYTQENVVLPKKKVGDSVNLESDILGKYVEKLLAGRLDAMQVAGYA